MPERKVIQLVLDERDAEALSGALSLAGTLLIHSKFGAGVIGTLQSMVIAIDDTGSEMIRCGTAETYGVPCREHHAKEVTRDQVREGRNDALARLERVTKMLAEFSADYRAAKIRSFPSVIASPDNETPFFDIGRG